MIKLARGLLAAHEAMAVCFQQRGMGLHAELTVSLTLYESCQSLAFSLVQVIIVVLVLACFFLSSFLFTAVYFTWVVAINTPPNQIVRLVGLLYESELYSFSLKFSLVSTYLAVCCGVLESLVSSLVVWLYPLKIKGPKV